jgi:small subunit ribosomal protein S5
MKNNKQNKNQDDRRKRMPQSVIEIRRTSKKTKGGNRIGFTALVAVGDGKGKVGLGLGKANDVRSAIQKGVRIAEKRMVEVPKRETTIPFGIEHKLKSTKVLLKPAKEGSGLIAGGPVRKIAEVAGIKDLVAKVFGSRNKSNCAYAVWEAFKKIKKIQEKHKVINNLKAKS